MANSVAKRAAIFGRLSLEAIETIVQRFETEFQANKIPLALKNGRNCTVCASDYRSEVNRKLLEGDFFSHIEKDYGVEAEKPHVLRDCDRADPRYRRLASSGQGKKARTGRARGFGFRGATESFGRCT